MAAGCLLLLLAPAAARGADPAPEAGPAADEPWSVHAQATVVSQEHGRFHSPYSGADSLVSDEPRRTSVTATLFLGARLPWRGAEIYCDPEVAGGEGFSGVHGIAGFPNGEIPRVGSPAPQPYIARLFLRQEWGLGGGKEAVEGGANQLGGVRDARRVTVTLGKVSAADLFDGNAYSHDPRTQFLNWSLMENGAWDYPADTRGYTLGGAVELEQPGWTLRYGAFAMPTVANGARFDPRISRARGQVSELVLRRTIRRRPSALRLLAFRNTARMGSYRQAIDHPSVDGPDVTASRAYRAKDGCGLRVEHQLAENLGFFTQVGWNDGRTESFVFTEIDRTAAAGLSLSGGAWHRPADTLGLAVVANGLSADHRAYLAAGGYGFLLGDGRLRYGAEEIGEAYYSFHLAAHALLSADFQLVAHPGYNRDRGPVAVAGARAHIEL